MTVSEFLSKLNDFCGVIRIFNKREELAFTIDARQKHINETEVRAAVAKAEIRYYTISKPCDDLLVYIITESDLPRARD